MEIKDIRKWDELSLGEKSEVMRTAVRRGMTRLDEIRKAWNEYAEGGSMDTIGEYADAIYDNATEEPYRDPTSHYNNVNEKLLATMSPDARGHYDDAVKLPNHPSSPIRGTFNGNYFDLTDEGMANPNYTLFGLLDNGDADTTLRYNGSYVLPEVTVTPQGNYFDDTYNNIKIKPKYANGGHLYKKGGVISQRNQRAGYAVDYFMDKGLSREAAAGLVGNLMRESGMNSSAVNPNSGAYGLGQWLGSRKTKLFKKYGKNPTFDNQLDYIWDELNTTHKKGLQMLRTSKTVDDAARNAFGYYEFSAGPEAAVAAMNKNGKNTKWKNPNGTVAMNNGINNAWIAYGKVTPKAKLGLNLGNVPTLGYNRTLPQFDFESIGDEIAEIGLPEQQFSANVLPPNPTDYGTPVDYSSLIRKKEPKDTQDEVFKDDGGLGLLSLISSLGGFGEKQQPLADYVPQKRSPFVVSTPTSNNTLLDDSWFVEGGPLYKEANIFAIGGPEGVTRTVGNNDNETTYHVSPEDYDDFLSGDYHVEFPVVDVTATAPRKRFIGNSLIDAELTKQLQDYLTTSNDATAIVDGRQQNSHLEDRGIKGAEANAIWEQEHPYPSTAGYIAGAAPFAVAAYPFTAGAGEFAYPFLMNPYVDAGLTAIGGADAGRQIYNGTANAWTALEMAPMFRLARPVYKAATKYVGLEQNPARNFSNGILSDIRRYVTEDNQWNQQKISDEASSGVRAAVDFLGSDVKKAADIHNKELASRLGFKDFSPFNDADKRASVPIATDLTYDPRATELGSVSIDGRNPANDKVTLNLASDLDKDAFHEYLHRGYYGTANGTAWNGVEDWDDWINRFKSTRSFYDWKNNKLLAPRTQENWEAVDYLSDHGEGPVNAMEIGRRMGIEPGTPFPGRERALELFNKFASSGDDKVEVFNGFNWKNKPRRIWDAITGRYVIIPTFMTGLGATAFGNYNNNQ